jgi:hypothetical protein
MHNKIVQITGVNSSLIALDDDGQLFRLGPAGWSWFDNPDQQEMRVRETPLKENALTLGDRLRPERKEARPL